MLVNLQSINLYMVMLRYRHWMLRRPGRSLEGQWPYHLLLPLAALPPVLPLPLMQTASLDLEKIL